MNDLVGFLFSAIGIIVLFAFLLLFLGGAFYWMRRPRVTITPPPPPGTPPVARVSHFPTWTWVSTISAWDVLIAFAAVAALVIVGKAFPSIRAGVVDALGIAGVVLALIVIALAASVIGKISSTWFWGIVLGAVMLTFVLTGIAGLIDRYAPSSNKNQTANISDSATQKPLPPATVPDTTPPAAVPDKTPPVPDKPSSSATTDEPAVTTEPAEQKKKRLKQPQQQATAQTPLDRACPQVNVPVTLGGRPVRINPNGQCSISLNIDDATAELYARRPNDPTTYGPLTYRDGLPDDTEYVWSADGPLAGSYRLSPPKERRRDSGPSQHARYHERMRPYGR